MIIEKVQHIDVEALHAQGFRGMIFDLDNTLVSWRRWSVTPAVLEWLQKAREVGFKMCILSNCIIKRRISRFSRLTGIPALPKASKPRKKSFQAALDFLGTAVEETTVIGDQVFTDVLGGNRMGLYTILVLPVDKREFYVTILQRTAEKIVLFRLRRKGILKEVPSVHTGRIFQSG
jgi:HAD superfamily phosphatase (TIGR01668 family)